MQATNNDNYISVHTKNDNFINIHTNNIEYSVHTNNDIVTIFGLRVTQFQFSVCMYCTCGRIDNKADLTWLDYNDTYISIRTKNKNNISIHTNNDNYNNNYISVHTNNYISISTKNDY